MMQFLRPALIVALGGTAWGVFFPSPVAAARCCLARPPTLNEQFVLADAAVLAKWHAGEEPANGSPGSTLYEVVQVPRATANAVKRRDRITVHQFCNAKKGSLALILGFRSNQGSIEWCVPLEVDTVLYNYVVRAPPRDAAGRERVLYYLDFL